MELYTEEFELAAQAEIEGFSTRLYEALANVLNFQGKAQEKDVDLFVETWRDLISFK